MKRTSFAVLMIALALVALAAPVAFAQAPAPKVTINGTIDNLTTYARNVSLYDGIQNLVDRNWYARTRGRFDVIGEVGKVKGVLGIEIDAAWGQTGASDITAPNAFGTSGSWDLNTDTRGIIEIKWLYTEFPVPLIPVPTTARLGAQPFGGAANYKLATYANGDFAGVNVVSALTPNVKLLATYVAVEEGLTGKQTINGLSGPNGIDPNRGDDYAYIFAAEVTPFKGLDIKPMFSGFHAQGTTSSSARHNRGGLPSGAGFAAGGGINEARYTVGADARLRLGPFSLDPTVLYQFGHRRAIAPASFAPSGAVTGRKYHADISAWLFDVRAGFQVGPLLIQGLGVYTTGNSARNNTLEDVHYFQPLDTDTSYLADWGTQLTSLGLDYFSAMNEAQARASFPGSSIGWDKYGRMQVGLKATYAITPALSIMAGANGHWTAEEVDRNSVATAGAGLLPTWNGNTPRERSRYLGTELMAILDWRFAPGITWSNGGGYMFAGRAMDAFTDPTRGGQNAHDAYILTSRLRYSF